MNTDVVLNFLATQGADFALKILGAIAAWVIGRWLIGTGDATDGQGAGARQQARRHAHHLPEVHRLGGADAGAGPGHPGHLRRQTTSFAALLAGAGLAIGAAWSGMLGNFAAGLFLQVLRPYKVGDFINAGGTLGTVKELGLFATTVLTPDNVLTVVGNNKVFADNIQNFSAEPFRRVDCVAKVANSVDVQGRHRPPAPGHRCHRQRAVPIRPLTSRSWSSRPRAPSSACAPTPTPTTTGRSTSTPTKSSSTPLARPAIQCRKHPSRTGLFEPLCRTASIAWVMHAMSKRQPRQKLFSRPAACAQTTSWRWPGWWKAACGPAGPAPVCGARV